MATEMAEPRPGHSSGAEEQVAAAGDGVDQRLPKSDRLRKRSSFLRLSRQGRRVHTRLFLAAYAPGDPHRTRLGITVTRKVGSAASRNRIKRQVREFFRTNRNQLPLGLDINVIAKKESGVADGPALRSSLGELFDRLRGGTTSKR